MKKLGLTIDLKNDYEIVSDFLDLIYSENLIIQIPLENYPHLTYIKLIFKILALKIKLN